MLVGIIRTRDLILHPVAAASVRGLWGFLWVLVKAFSRERYRFVDLLGIGGGLASKKAR